MISDKALLLYESQGSPQDSENDILTIYSEIRCQRLWEKGDPPDPSGRWVIDCK